MESARILIQITAGVLPGTPIDEYTKTFGITSDEWYAQGKYDNKPNEAKQEILKIYGYAQEYARDLMNPKILNWVRFEWIYL